MGDKAYYSCKFGYVLVGDETRECLSDGLWSSTMPCCEIGKSILKSHIILKQLRPKEILACVE